MPKRLIQKGKYTANPVTWEVKRSDQPSNLVAIHFSDGNVYNLTQAQKDHMIARLAAIGDCGPMFND